MAESDYTVTIEELFFEADGDEHVNEEGALAVLLADDVLFSNYREYGWEGKPSGKTTVLFVNCNDMFSWGTADAEQLPPHEIGHLLRMHLADKKWGAMKWCMLQRNQKPQAPVERDMRLDGSWDDAMDALPVNTQDAEVHAYVASLNDEPAEEPTGA